MVKPLYHLQLRPRLVVRIRRRVPTTSKSKLRRHRYCQGREQRTHRQTRVFETIPAHGFGMPDLFSETVFRTRDSHDESYDSAWDLRTVTVFSTFKQSLFCVLMSQYRRINPLNSHVFNYMVTVVCGLCLLSVYCYNTRLVKTLGLHLPAPRRFPWWSYQ